ncbi:MAG: sulfatase [Gemmatimonadota bacterium]
MTGDAVTAKPLVLAVWSGLAASVLELVILGVEKFGFGMWIHADARILWLAPVSWVLWLLPVGLCVAVGIRLVPMKWRASASVFALTLVSSLGVLWLFYPRLHRGAIVVLSLGLAVQATRVAVPRLAALQSRALRRGAAAAAVLVTTALVTSGGPLLRERWEAARSAAARPGVPNVLLVVLDAVRAESLSAYGNPRPTSPALERLAERGVRFTSAWATASWTLPSHASLFTGRYPHELSAGWVSPLDGAAPTLAESLAAAGYRTAGFVGNLLYCSRETGLSRGFEHYEDAVVSPGEIAMSSELGRFVIQNPTLRRWLGYYDVVGRRSATAIVRSFLDWQSGVRGPFFAFVNLYDAHAPYLPPEPWASRFANGVERRNDLIRHTSKRSGARTRKVDMTEAETEAELRAYEAGIAYMDAELDSLFAALDRRGVLSNTVVIVTSDHGELFGEHGRFAHGQHLYRPLIEVPLIVAGPGVATGEDVDRVVSLRDLAATILDLSDRDAAGLPGTSLAALWNGARSDASPALAEVNPAPNQVDRRFTASSPMRSLTRGDYLYIGWAEGRERLFDLAADPEEHVDLAGEPRMADLVEGLRAEAESFGGWRWGAVSTTVTRAERVAEGGAELALSGARPGAGRSP